MVGHGAFIHDYASAHDLRLAPRGFDAVRENSNYALSTHGFGTENMSRLGPALSFYIKHGDDVSALVERIDDGAPNGISSEDWEKFKRVVGLANEEVATLLDSCRARIIEALDGAIVTIGKGAARTQIAKDWDAWRGFAAPRSVEAKRVQVGWLGAYLVVEDNTGGKLCCYLRPTSAGGNFRDALKTPDPPDLLPPESAVVFTATIDTETDIEALITACGEKFGAARDALRRHLLGAG